MKTFTTDAQAALEAGEALESAAVRVGCSPTPVLIWGGFGVLQIAGENYNGVGKNMMVEVSTGALGGAEVGTTVNLSGLDPEALALFDAASLYRAPVIIRRLIYDKSGRNLLDAQIFERGRVDGCGRDETPGGAAKVSLQVETAARGMGKAGGRMRSDADQRLISGTDGGMANISFAGLKMIYWGGKLPVTAGSAVSLGQRLEDALSHLLGKA